MGAIDVSDKRGSGTGEIAKTGNEGDGKTTKAGGIEQSASATAVETSLASAGLPTVKSSSATATPNEGTAEAEVSKPDPAEPGASAETQAVSGASVQTAADAPSGAPGAKPENDAAVIAASSVPNTSTAKPQISADAVKPDMSKLDAAKSEGTKPDLAKPSPVKSASAKSSSSVPPQSSAPQAPAHQPRRRSGFFPTLLGGVCAAAIGFGAAYYILPQLGVFTADTSVADAAAAQLDGQRQRIEALEVQIANLSAAPAAPDLSGLKDGQQSIEAQITDQAAQLTALAQRTDAIEARPPAEGTGISPDQLSALREAMSAQVARLDALTDEAAQRDEAARMSARLALRLTALTRIRTALDTGSGFAPALGDLERAGMSAPAPLQGVAEVGVPTQADLQNRFAPAARAALANARTADDGAEGEAGFWSFMSEQLGARSLERREGPGADAVLSRAEDYVRQGMLQSALTEIDTLPDSVKAEFADWAGDVRARIQAVAAHDALVAKLN